MGELIEFDFSKAAALNEDGSREAITYHPDIAERMHILRQEVEALKEKISTDPAAVKECRLRMAYVVAEMGELEREINIRNNE